MLINEFMPVYDVSDAVATVVDADLPTTWAALMDVDLIAVGRKRPLVAVLGALRVLPTSSAICCTASCRLDSQSACGSAGKVELAQEHVSRVRTIALARVTISRILVAFSGIVSVSRIMLEHGRALE